MKTLFLSLLCVCMFSAANAQKTLPEIKAGTVMYASAFVNGSEFPLLLTIKSISAPLSIGWSVDGYGEGSFDMTPNSVASATSLFNTGQPAMGVTKIGDNETFGLISKAAYKTLSTTKTFTYGGSVYKIKADDTAPLKIGGKEIDATHVISEQGKIELWILNNPDLPLVLQSLGLETDISISEIK